MLHNEWNIIYLYRFTLETVTFYPTGMISVLLIKLELRIGLVTRYFYLIYKMLIPNKYEYSRTLSMRIYKYCVVGSLDKPYYLML